PDSRPAACSYSLSKTTRPPASAPARSPPARSAARASGSSHRASPTPPANPALPPHTSRHTLHAVPASGTRCNAPATGWRIPASTAPPCVIARPSLTLGSHPNGESLPQRASRELPHPPRRLLPAPAVTPADD